MMNPEENFCFMMVMGLVTIWFMFAWMVTYETGDKSTQDFLFWDAVTDDPFIAWYMSSDSKGW